MFQKELFKKKVEESGLKYLHIARTIGITDRGLMFKINGHSQFKSDEIAKIKDMLHLSADDVMAIFFGDDVA